ncbi:MAG: DUF86 domain-containing protein [Dehalococcoidales bacterium]|nr:DUF86 domain-containing protein [Dehalococcoidales bacterium]
MRSPEADVVRLHHMLEYAQKAAQFTRGRNRADLDENEMLSLAVIHLIFLIGEAAYGVNETTQEKHPEIPWKLITGTRNRLAHGYIDVDLDIIWAIVKKDLPGLIRKLKKILQ